MQAIQSRHFLTFLLGLLAQTAAGAGQQAFAMETVENAIAMAEATGEHFYDSELHRLRGELLLHPSFERLRESEASFDAALAIARKQGAQTFECKAMESLHRYFGR
jgi:predicted ATPase